MPWSSYDEPHEPPIIEEGEKEVEEEHNSPLQVGFVLKFYKIEILRYISSDLKQKVIDLQLQYILDLISSVQLSCGKSIRY